MSSTGFGNVNGVSHRDRWTNFLASSKYPRPWRRRRVPWNATFSTFEQITSFWSASVLVRISCLASTRAGGENVIILRSNPIYRQRAPWACLELPLAHATGSMLMCKEYVYLVICLTNSFGICPESLGGAGSSFWYFISTVQCGLVRKDNKW